MPMSFPNMQSLEHAAEAWKFRKLKKGETEIQYRNELADFVQNKDAIESMEIRSGKGWDQWNDGDNASALGRFAAISMRRMKGQNHEQE